jgi:tripartite-type tricarboxylate transporter receptor subunit TctC
MHASRHILGLFLSGLTILGLVSVDSVRAEDSWPNGPVTFVIPQPAGSPLDVMARPMAMKLQEKWGKPVVIENRGGATGTIGTNYVVRATPDGYTFLYTPDLPITTAPNLIKAPYDPVQDLDLIAAFADSELMLDVHPSLGVKTLSELIAKAKANPGKLTYATGGIASPAHLCAEMIRQAAGIDIIHVPYRGAGPAMQALVAGEVDMFCGPPTLALPLVKSGRVVPIGTTGATRAPLTPDVPTLLESGIKDLVIVSTMYFMAPKGMDPALRARVKADFKAVLEDPDTQQRFAAIAVSPKWLEGQAGTQLIRDDLARWGEVIRKGNIKAE